MEYSACAAECNVSLLTGTPPTPRPLRLLSLFQLVQTQPTIIQPAPSLRNVLAAPPQASCCPSSPPCAPTRSTLQRCAAACGTCSTCPSASSSSSCDSSSRYFRYRAALSVRIVANIYMYIPCICSVLRLRLVTGRLRVGCCVAVAARGR